jgi:conjugal transfer/entry exclusion protein
MSKLADADSVNYDQVTDYSVDPKMMKTKLDNIKHEVQNVQDYLQVVQNALLSLNLAWAGESADEANDFNNRWQRTMDGVWGTKEHPETGVLNSIIGGLSTATNNYGTVESSLYNVFKLTWWSWQIIVAA